MNIKSRFFAVVDLGLVMFFKNFYRFFRSKTKIFVESRQYSLQEKQGIDLRDKKVQRYIFILYSGKKLYEQLEHGGTVVLWQKVDFINYIEYYKLIDLPFILHMETDYMELTPRYMFFAILTHMNKPDEEIERILGISPGTVRSNRSRIRSKRKSYS